MSWREQAGIKQHYPTPKTASMFKTSLDTIIQEFHLIQSPHDDDNMYTKRRYIMWNNVHQVHNQKS
jgi:hypothetical protein